MMARLAHRISRYLRPDPYVALQHSISKELKRADPMAQGGFPKAVVLPSSYGKGLPERVVELLFASLSYHPGTKVLDVGYAHAMPCHLEMIRRLAQPKDITGIDIARPPYDPRPFYRQTIVGDITAAPWLDAAFDLVWCISLLEHVGMDNSGYADHFQRKSEMDQQALREMLRLLAPGATLLVTVPYGRYEDHGWLRNYDRAHWQKVLDVARPVATIYEWYFRHTFAKGWSIVDREELQYVGYYDQANSGAGGLAVAHITN